MARSKRQPTSSKPALLLKRFYKSIWFFPAILLVPLFAFTILQISGSSLGFYHILLYNDGKDPALISGQPQTIRSDEWVVNTQMTIAQDSNDYQRINKNIGNGEDMSLLVDVPYKEWSVAFKPHNLSFFVMPFDNAFAFRWWIMAYLLIVSAYLFIATLLPGKRLFAALLATAFYFSPFIQWWYLYGTIGTLYYALFGMTVFVKLLNTKSLKAGLGWSALLAYIATCFVLILYPPFQIPCALAAVAFAIGYALEKLLKEKRAVAIQKVALVGAAMLVAGLIAGLFVITRHDVIQAVQNTAYPGKRIINSGGYNGWHLLSGQLDSQLKSIEKSANYQIPELSITNQSEISNFVFVWPFLLIPGILLLIADRKSRKKSIDWPLLSVSLLFLILSLWLFVPGINFLGKLTLLNIVPHNRLVIGLGLLGLIQLALIVRREPWKDKRLFSPLNVTLYCLAILIVGVIVDLHIRSSFPGYIGGRKALALALPIPLIVFGLLRGYLKSAAVVMLLLCFYMTGTVNPLYKGTEALTASPVEAKIKQAASQDKDGKWAIENGYLENFASMSGARSISGVYTYPQLSLWQSVDPQHKQEDIYNRYAHVSINFDRNGNVEKKTSLLFPNADHFGIYTEPCSKYLKEANVRFAVTELPLADSDKKCATLLSTTKYPTITLYIYKLN